MWSRSALLCLLLGCGYAPARGGPARGLRLAAVKNDTYQPWAERVSTAFNKSGIQGTPTLKLNGKVEPYFERAAEGEAQEGEASED